MHRSMILFAPLIALGIFASVPVQAQVSVAPQPGYPAPYSPSQYAPGGYPPQNFQGYPSPYTPQNGAQGRPQFQPPPAQTQGPALPSGIDHLYGMEGTNEILLYGTKKGYDLARQIIKGLDGDWNITRTQVVQVRETPQYLTRLGVTLGHHGALSSADSQKLMDARRQGKLTACQTLQIESGNNEETDAVLGRSDSGLPLSLTTKIESGVQIHLDLTDPVSRTFTLRPGETAVVAVPPANSAANPIVTLLFLTPSIQSQG